MKKISKSKALILLAGIFFVIGLAESTAAFAATTVNLGTANSFGVLAGTGIANTGTTTITGDIGSFATTTITGAPTVLGTNHGGDATTQLAKTSLSTAYGNAAGQPCDINLTGQDLGGLTLTPGVYCFNSSAQLTGILTLNGGNNPEAIFVFQIGSTLTTASSSSVSLINGAKSQNVFWQVGSSATLGTTTNFSGTILALTSITLTTGATVDGRMLAQNGTVTLDTNTITVPTALHLRKIVSNNNGGTAANTDWTLTATGTGVSPTNLSGTTPVDSGATFKGDTYALAESGGSSGYIASTYSCVKNGGAPVVSNSITLVAGDDAICTITNDDIAPQLHLRKVINNTHGGIATVTDFILTANGTGTNDLSGTSPVDSGAGLFADTFALSETGPSGYSASSWVCVGGTQSGSNITVGINQSATCTITNDDIAPIVPPVPPLISVLKVPSPLSLPAGPGSVTYTYTLTNIGTVAATDITMIDDSCSPVTFVSGDTNSNSILDLTETWTYQCTMTLSATHTNNVIATGWANGLSATDTASATVVVGIPVVPPLIHVTKVPNPLALPSGGGIVTYTETLTNPGTIAINNITLIDDKCTPMTYISGDSNSDSKLDITETWTYTCQTNLSNTTTNIAIASGEANGLTATDTASATVVVAHASSGGGGSSINLIPPIIDVVKIPKPLALPKGPGSVMYTYTVRNIGTISMSNITLVDDSCRTMKYVSGDTNNDKNLNTTETWIYNCSTTLSATHTNTVVATGWANSIRATDIASATVIVGKPILPPLIHVTKVPDPLTLPAGGGMVNYIEEVTNPGTVPLSNVNLIDDKCSPLGYIYGDTNGNSKLETNETWTYSCQSNITKTTTNTAIVTGESNGITARDFAIVTVVVADQVPALPNTGFPPSYKVTLAKIGALIGILMLVFSSFIIATKRH